jgi:hypothetical protein
MVMDLESFHRTCVFGQSLLIKCYKMLQRCICCYCLNSKVPTYAMHTIRVMQFIKENSWESVKFCNCCFAEET